MMGSGGRVSRWAAFAFLALAASSCSSDESTGPAPSISISLSTGTLTITQGASGSVNVTLTRENGFADAVAVTVEGLPTGVTVPALSLPASSTSGTLTFTVASTAVVATTPLTVRATGPGVTAVTQSLSLVVQAAPAPGAFTMGLSPTSLSVQQGASGSTTVTITRTGSFTGAVALTATGLPAGVTPTFNPASVTTPNTSTLTLAASATATTGTVNVTITGSGTGVTNQTATLALTVTAATASGSFTLAFSPTTLSVQQGQSASTTVTIARVGAFTGAVALTASGLPAGVTPSFNPASVTATTSTLTLTASATATTGTVNVSVTGTGTGVANVTGTFGLTVTAAPSGGGNVSVAFCPGIGVPLWVAFQDGTGAWTQSTLANGTYSGTVNSGRGGVAYVTPVTGGGFQLNVRYGTTAELQSFNQVFCYGNTGTGKTVNVTVAGTTITDIGLLALGTSAATAGFGQTPVFNNVPDGTIDLLGARGAINVQTGGISINKFFAQRGITPAANSTVNVDFAGANSTDPATGTITLANLGTDQGIMAGLYLSANRTTLAYPIDTGGTATTRTFVGFPTSAGSFHLIQATAVANLQTFTSMRAAAVVAATVGARTLTLGSDLGTVTVTAVSNTPVLRPQAVIPVGAYTGSWSASYTQGTSGANYRAAAVQATSGYVTGSPTTVTLVIPDLSGGGFQSLWGLFDTTTNWNVQAQAITGFGAQGQWQDGATLLFALRTGTLSTQQEE